MSIIYQSLVAVNSKANSCFGSPGSARHFNRLRLWLWGNYVNKFPLVSMRICSIYHSISKSKSKHHLPSTLRNFARTVQANKYKLIQDFPCPWYIRRICAYLRYIGSNLWLNFFFWCKRFPQAACIWWNFSTEIRFCGFSHFGCWWSGIWAFAAQSARGKQVNNSS